jgi:predicted GTPase
LEACEARNNQEIENENGGPMASKTSKAKKYYIKIGHVSLTIIDTPGFGDSRGPDVDE